MMRLRLVLLVLLASLISCSQGTNLDSSIEPISTLTSVPISYTATPLPQTPTPKPSFGERLAAVFLSDSEELGIYSNPGDTISRIEGLEAHSVDIQSTGKTTEIDGVTWLEVRTPNGNLGWVNGRYVTPYIPPDEFCNSSDVNIFLDELFGNFESASGEELSMKISPYHGLRVRYHWKNSEIHYNELGSIKNIFTSSDPYDWGIERKTSESVVGTFGDIIYPSLLRTIREGNRYCNSLEQGLAADWVEGFIQWPFEYTNLNYVSVYQPAQEGDELNWHTFAFGIERYSDVYFLSVILQYKWDF